MIEGAEGEAMEIDDRSDCRACSTRLGADLSDWAAHRLDSLGEAICPECGRTYLVLVYGDSAPGDPQE